MAAPVAEPLTSIGKMRHRVMIQTPTAVPDGQGGNTTTWGTFKEVWAELLPSAREETNYGGRIQVARSHVMNIRYLPGLKQDMRVTYQGRTFQIRGSFKVDERRYWMRVNLEEDVGT